MPFPPHLCEQWASLPSVLLPHKFVVNKVPKELRNTARDNGINTPLRESTWHKRCIKNSPYPFQCQNESDQTFFLCIRTIERNSPPLCSNSNRKNRGGKFSSYHADKKKCKNLLYPKKKCFARISHRPYVSTYEMIYVPR